MKNKHLVISYFIKAKITSSLHIFFIKLHFTMNLQISKQDDVNKKLEI